MFTDYPRYDPYRIMRYRRLRPMRGEDVYALQKAINTVLSYGLKTDGVFGPLTRDATKLAQRYTGELEDGWAGQLTQAALVYEIVKKEGGTSLIAPGLVIGQLEHESSLLLGNYSALRPDGTYDAGVAQHNTLITPPTLGFDPGWSVKHLIDYVREHYELYHDLSAFRGDDHSEHRRWGLAAGSWNAPAYTNWLAGVQPWATPGPTALQKIEAYIAAVTVYLK